MKILTELLKNTWFVGIFTGIISGILVFIITNWFTKKNGKAEYLKQVNAANIDVINSLKPYIADQGLPQQEVFQSIIMSISRQYGVDSKDMFSISIFCEELIYEIISDVYVSCDKKKEYTKDLAEYKNAISLTVDSNIKTNAQLLSNYNNAFDTLSSTLIATISAIITAFLVYATNNHESFYENLLSLVSSFSDTTYSILVVMIILIFGVFSLKKTFEVTIKAAELAEKISKKSKETTINPKEKE